MAKIVDARGLACPQPVILTRDALKETREVITIVDNETARANVTRLAEQTGATVKVEQKEDGIYLHITKEPTAHAEPSPSAAGAPAGGPLVLVIPSEIMGRGDEELGSILIRGFFHTLGEVEPLPDKIIFFNSGVKLVIENSPMLEDLQALVARGVEILACGTCLGHYGLTEQVAVGEVSNMYTIAETMLGAGRVVSL
ncbi:MAG: sulfurtransferase-like selenium metabolism protein YedF [Anaerolineae bacterium]|jgi:selenium metabolism protein YedF|nr:sulfurtransferase-like selenium metabolism protein YedF [Anaerolineae bacterium]MDH7473794.1 sulfurtransferase-like selenium metabolism protein YedF [Anaerolineae bacterium]